MTASTLNLSQLRARLQALLVDAGALVWSSDTLDEAIRQALNDAGRVLGVKLTLSGLDSALLTSIDARDDDLVIRGAAGYAARSRSLDRAERVNLAAGTPPALFEWGKNQLDGFNDQLKQVRARGLQASGSAPASALAWDESAPGW